MTSSPPPWSAAPCAITCRCGASHVAAIHNDITGRVRVRVLEQSASVAGWYDVRDTWLCGRCYGSAVLEATLQARAGMHDMRRAIDTAADRRAWLAAMEVGR